MVEAGQAHSMALKSDSTLWAWGYNTAGSVGDSTTVNKLIPTAIAPNKRWISISAGGAHSLAIDKSGALYAWGDNTVHQLGDSTTTQRITPTQIGSDNNWEEVSAGFQFSTALKNNHTIWSWGFNGNAQLGDGTTTNVLQPKQIGSETNWKMIIAGASFGFALKNDSTLWGWGYNGQGQLGTGDKLQKKIPIQIGDDADFVAVAAAEGFYYNGVYGLHTLALHTNRDVICATGANYIGQLGDGTTTTISSFNCNTGLITGIKEIVVENKPLFDIYPNPSDGVFTVSSNKTIKTISIYDSYGRLVKQNTVNELTTKLSITEMVSGIYFVQVETENSVSSQKVVLQK
jgi:alpha-tubulin suppressor-like RCC1 family protein